MRYVRESRHSEATIDLAERLFERAVGRRVVTDRYEDTVVIRNSIGELPHRPVTRIESVHARCEDYEYADVFGPTDYAPIPIEQVAWSGEGKFVLPSSVYGVPYSRARVVYDAGLTEVPDEIVRVILESARLIDAGQLDEWSGSHSLSDESLATIDRYRRA